MTVLPDHWIADMARRQGMIDPLARKGVGTGRISSGISSYGYDFRLSDQYRIPDLEPVSELDPKHAEKVRFEEYRGRSCLVPGGSFLLGRSLEYFRIPRDVLVICQGKSTYARCGLVVNVTPLEPEWEGYITISLVNTTAVPVRVYSGEGIAQAMFLRAESECARSYADKKGKYQTQKEIQPSRV